MTAVVFVGPTLRPAEVAAACDAVCLPPVAQGDVLRAARRRPSAIGIVDGYFGGAPSVWHKEILWALSRGIHVFGSASMGALRAAELDVFGMRGVGRIFEAFRDGALEDDDEVAIVHGPFETGFAPASEPMVNIRATLARAEAEGVLAARARVTLETRAKALFFSERSWPALLEGADCAEREALRLWLPQGRIDQKRLDALAMLAEMRATLAGSEPHRPGFSFAWTQLWDELAARPEVGVAIEGHPEALAARILDELRLSGPDVYGAARSRALLRLFSAGAEERQSTSVPAEAKRATLSALRASLGLFNRAELEAWMGRNHLDAAALESLVEDEARSRAASARLDQGAEKFLLDELRLSGAYERLAQRATDKMRKLMAHGGDDGAASGSPEPMFWYFAERLGRPVPDDIGAFARELGFADRAAFDAAVRREWLYIQSGPE